jgi:hypothetical protein
MVHRVSHPHSSIVGVANVFELIGPAVEVLGERGDQLTLTLGE